jgi:glycosyltransferase involved in cell wall biosynthesis
MSEQPQDPFIDPTTGKPWTKSQRVKRALARRLPRTARAFHWARAKTRHFAGRALYRLGRLKAMGRWIRDVSAQISARRRRQALTIAVDATPLWDPLTGVGWYLYKILEQLADEPGLAIRLYGPVLHNGPDVPGPVVPLPRGRAIEQVVIDVPHDLVIAAGWLMTWIRGLSPILIALDGNRVLFAPNYFLPRRFLLARGRRVATVHDLGLHKVPETLQEETRVALARHLQRSASRAKRLISVSAAVRDELVEHGYATADKIDVIHHGPGQLAGIEASELPTGVSLPFALHVGTLEPRKNILFLLAVWDTLHERGGEVPRLVLCGKYGWKTDALSEAVRAATDKGRALHLGYVAEGELAALYAAATLVVFPTRYEGFGLPAVEAQLAGAPLVCSDLPVLREVAGDGAVYAPPDDPAAFADAVARLLCDPQARAELAERGRRNTDRLSWRRAADLTAAAWRDTAGVPSSPVVSHGPVS